ncbi:MAG: hypothetical protein JRI81_06345 [Deltaproteobacteria bacterium]|nr:hypothetical protein [Deltaproteobacteria bacterium]
MKNDLARVLWTLDCEDVLEHFMARTAEGAGPWAFGKTDKKLDFNIGYVIV